MGAQEERFWQEAFTVYSCKAPSNAGGRYDWYCGAALLEPVLKQVSCYSRSDPTLEFFLNLY